MNFETHWNRMPPEKENMTKIGASSLSGKLMFAAIIVMFVVIILILCFHLYVRYYILRSRPRRNGGAHLVFYVEPIPRGLESTVLNSLPVFVYSPEKYTHLPECAVCLSEFEANEKGRLLPNCNHSFHVDCIDMWFHSHSTCPLCRSSVEPVKDKNHPEPVKDKNHPEPGHTEPGPTERINVLAIDIPRRGSTDAELGHSSPAASQGFISPVTRFLSFTSMLSINRRSAPGTPSGVGTSSGETSVLDIEKSLEDSNKNQSRAQTPR